MGNTMNRQKIKQHLSFLQIQAKKLDKGNNSRYIQSAMDVMFTQIEEEYAQIPAHEGIKKYVEQAVAAMIKEFQQLDNGAIPRKRVVSPINASTLTYEDKKKALDAVNLIKKKISGQIKGRTCANGSKQRKYLGEDVSVASPTISLEALFATRKNKGYDF